MVTAPVSVEHPPEWPVYSKEAVARASALIEAGRTFDYGYGEEIAALEDAFGELFGRHALAVNSGTSALLAAYHALGLGPGDEVVVPSLTFYSTATPLLLLRAVPVLCDAGDGAGNVTAQTIEERLTERTRAVVVTHLFGWPCDMDEIVALCRRYGLALIEDCSHAHGSRYRGRRVGTFGDFAVFSIGGNKLVSGGLGGILLSSERGHHETACLLANFRPRTRSTVHDPALRAFVETGLGGNLRISPIAAVLATSHLTELDRMAATRDRNVRRLLNGLARYPELFVGTEVDRTDVVNGGWYGVNVGVRPGTDLDALVERGHALGLQVRRPSTVPLHRAALFRQAAPPTWRAEDRQGWLAAVRDRPQPRAEELYHSWLAYPANFLYDEMGTIVDPYIEGTGWALRSHVA
jgi:dTDP-4-amino-4,6-dideoxygalactose transaminase